MEIDFEKCLLEASAEDKNNLPVNNPFRDVGFDGDKKRLGWARGVTFCSIKESLDGLSYIFEGKKNFIFVGMGGSINGIKPLLKLFKSRSFYVLDNLDPAALLNIINDIEELDKTLVVSISKSGTTKETQLLSLALKELFLNRLGEEALTKHFLWLSDGSSFSKLASLGWEKTEKGHIQADKEDDIGGRFSSPHTLIFLLPLFLLLEKDYNKLESVYNSFISLQEEIRAKALDLCQQYRDKADAYFAPFVEERMGDSFSSWIVQLFQESIGSKSKGLEVKTVTNLTGNEVFAPVKLDLYIDDPVTALMSQMYFFQVFVAFYSAFRKINFVTQNFVEMYKREMNKLENCKDDSQLISKPLNLEGIISEVGGRIKKTQQFIEIVLYYFPDADGFARIRQRFAKDFPGRQVLVFVGSDWNHQSYQSAFGSNDTFYVLITSPCKSCVPGISDEIIKKNVDTLELIARATYLTIKDKAVIFSLHPNQ